MRFFEGNKQTKCIVVSTATVKSSQACEYTKKTKQGTKAGGGQKEHTPNVKDTVPDRSVTPT